MTLLELKNWQRVFIFTNFRHSNNGIPQNCAAITFSCSFVYLSIKSRVDGFDMDPPFKWNQVASTTAPSTGDANLASIVSLVSNISSSKNAPPPSDNDEEKTIDYNNMMKDMCDPCNLKHDPSKIQLA